jgi:hypothetical protein
VADQKPLFDDVDPRPLPELEPDDYAHPEDDDVDAGDEACVHGVDITEVCEDCDEDEDDETGGEG